jgi:c(7)-type cytochrome triheme protein
LRRFWLLSALSLAAGLVAIVALAGVFKLPEPVPPDRYGTVLIDRQASTGACEPVVFSHWRHRARFSCRVCHYELGFELLTNSTEITEADNRHGLFCGACHDGGEAFSVTDNARCKTCHAGTIKSKKIEFKTFSKKLPKASYGNKVDWVQAQEKLKPRYSFFKNEKPMDFDKELLLQADWTNVPAVVFSHDVHGQFLDCANCHPDVFNIKKKTTEHFDMRFILEKKFCGACHLTVAFPLDNCRRCHPKMHRNM